MEKQKQELEQEMFCAPDINSGGVTCYSKKDLVFLIKAYNKKRPKSHNINFLNKSKKDLWVDLNRKLSRDCNNEWCWLEQKFVPAPYAKKWLEYGKEYSTYNTLD